MAFLNEKNDAEYLFYKDYPNLRLDVELPDVCSDDIVMFGSFYAISPQLRDKIKELLDKARSVGAIIYYDVNFRSTHKNDAIKLLPTILENFEYADPVHPGVFTDVLINCNLELCHSDQAPSLALGQDEFLAHSG